MTYNPVATIARKRDGHSLTPVEIADLIGRYARNEIPDYQMAAFAMAVFCQGMDVDETAALTQAMLASGAVLQWGGAGGAVVDKHSTGGIGDKTSLILAPLLACCGLRVPMISGRGLGPTGGTLDKLEAIPGFRTDLSRVEIETITERTGCVITGATSDLVPADRKLYALRDVTATVPSIPLITASIMSKKLSESLSALVLDVKFGDGAFMKTVEQARALARSLVSTGVRMGVATTALLTDMNQPLGRMIGNANEVLESLDVLRNAGPHRLRRLTLDLAIELLLQARVDTDRTAAEARLCAHLASGRALQKFDEMVRAQGGRLDELPALAPKHTVAATKSGFVHAIANEELGWLVIDLGGGRRQLTDRIDHRVGFEMSVEIGDAVTPGTPLFRVFCDRSQFDTLQPRLAPVVTLADTAPPATPVVLDRVTL